MFLVTATEPNSNNNAVSYWPYIAKLGIVRIDSKNKIYNLETEEQRKQDVNTIDYEARIKDGCYNSGVAVRLGWTIGHEYYALGIDLDGWHAVKAWFGGTNDLETWNRVTEYAKNNRLEWHKDKTRLHLIIYLCSKTPKIKNKVIALPEDNQIEIRGKGQLLCVSPSIAKDGNPFCAMDNEQIPVIDGVKELELNSKIDSLAKEYLSDKNSISEWLHNPNTIFAVGNGRHNWTVWIVNSYFRKYKDEWLDLTDEERFDRAWRWHSEHCNPPRSREEFDKICRDVVKKFKVDRDKLHKEVRESKEKGNNKNKNTNKEKQTKKEFFASMLKEVMKSDKYKTLKDTEEVLYYNPVDGIYHLGAEQNIKAYLERRFEELEQMETGIIEDLDNNFRNEIISHIRYSTLTDRKQFDANPDLLHFKNGYYDLATGKFSEGHSSDYPSRIVIPHNYDPKAKCPKIVKFLLEVLPPSRVKTILKMWGYCLLGNCKYQKGFMLYGKGKNGKSVVLSITRAFVGEENCSSISLQDICNSKFSTWLLDGKMVNTFGDLPNEPIRDMSKFKSLVVGEELNAERKFHDEYTFKNKAKMIFSANTIPEMKEKTYANYRRWELIEFEKVFDAIDDKKGLKDELISDEAEMSGVIKLALIGLQMLQREQGFDDMPVEKIKEEYENNSNDIEPFLEDRYVVNPLSKEFETKADDIKSEFERYCEEKAIRLENRSNESKLGSILTAKGCMRKRLMRNKKRDYYYVGIVSKSELKNKQATLRD